jgi:hypothetical protein
MRGSVRVFSHLVGGVCSCALFALLSGCSSNNSPSNNPPPAISVALNPTTASLSGSGVQVFAANVANDSSNAGVSWSIGTGAGTLSASSTNGVTYTAPSSISSVATVTLTATSMADASVSSAATITLNPPVAPTITSVTASCIPASVQTNLTSQCTATVTGTGSYSSTVTWSVSGVSGGNSTVGTITSAGVYTAPSAVPATNPVSITATSTEDTTKSGSASVTVTASVVAVSISPTSPTVNTGATQQFTAAVTGTTNTAVNWSVDGVTGGNSTDGTISASGLYTAPAVVPTPNTVDITATIVADSSVSSSTTVTVIGTVESSTQTITAANGGTITLPNGSSVTIPAGAFASDYSVTLSLVTGLPKQPPSGFIVGAGDALVLSTSTPPFNTSAGNLQFVIDSGANTSGLQESSGLADLIDSTGDNFFGVTGSFDANTNLSSITVSAPLMTGTKSVVVSMSNLPPPYTSPTGAVRGTAESTLPFAAADTTPPSPGQLSWNGTGWTPYSGCSAPVGSKVLVLVHGMASSVEGAFGNDGNPVTVNGTPNSCVNQIVTAAGTNASGQPTYGQVVGFDYDWTTDIGTGSGASFASFLNTLAACGNSIDIEAHSEGGPVAASGVTQASPATQALITNFVGLGNPWAGTPTASGAATVQGFVPFTTMLMNPLLVAPGIIAEYVPMIQGRTIESVLNAPFLPQLAPGSSLLTTIQQGLGPSAPNLKMTLACGNQPQGVSLRVTDAFGNLFSSSDDGFPANDGIISLSSCQGAGPTGTGNVFTGLTPNLLAPYALSHTQLACDSQVIQDVGKAVQNNTKPTGPALVANPASIPFGTEPQGYSGPIPSQGLAITSSGSALAWVATVSSGAASWLSLVPVSGTTPTTPTVSAIVGSAGTYNGTITITATGASNSLSIPVTLTVTPATNAYAGSYSAPFAGTADDPNGGVYSASADLAFTLNLTQNSDGSITGTASVPTNINIAVVSCPSADTCSANSFTDTATGPVTGSNGNITANLSSGGTDPLTIAFTGVITGNSIAVTGSFSITLVGTGSDGPPISTPLTGTIAGLTLTKQ